MLETPSGEPAPVGSVDPLATTPSTPAGNGSFATSEQLSELTAALQKLAPLSNIVGAMGHDIKKLKAAQAVTPEAAPTATPEEGSTAPAPANLGIVAAEKAIDTLRAELNHDTALAALERGLHALGAEHPEKFAQVLAADMPERLKVEGRTVTVEDGAGFVSVPDFLNAYTKTPDGSWMLPARPASSVSLDGGAPPAAEVTELSFAELNNLSSEQLKSGKYVAK